jgi:hypothetical protein
MVEHPMFTKPVHGGFLMEYLIPSMDNFLYEYELSGLPHFPGHLAISLRRFCFKAT